MTGVRWAGRDGWEGYCPVCVEWWPLDLEFWTTHSQGGMCRACYRIADAARHRARRQADPELREREAAVLRAARATPAGKAANRARSAEWRKRNPDRKKRTDQEFYQSHYEKIRAYQNDYRQRLRAERALARDSAA